MFVFSYIFHLISPISKRTLEIHITNTLYSWSFRFSIQSKIWIDNVNCKKFNARKNSPHNKYGSWWTNILASWIGFQTFKIYGNPFLIIALSLSLSLSLSLVDYVETWNLTCWFFGQILLCFVCLSSFLTELLNLGS